MYIISNGIWFTHLCMDYIGYSKAVIYSNFYEKITITTMTLSQLNFGLQINIEIEFNANRVHS